MISRATLGQAKSQILLGESIGVASCDSRFVPLVNTAQRYLAAKGRWWGTYQKVYVCLAAPCITWPRGVANIEAFRICRGVPVLNLWYEFGDFVKPPDLDSCACAPPMLLDRASSPQFLDSSVPRRFRIYPRVASDAGKKVILQGVDSATSRVIRTQVGSTYITGEQVTLANPFATSAFTFAAPGLTGVQKPITNGVLDVYALDPDTAEETKVAEWGASELAPSYRRSYLTSAPTTASTQYTGDGCGVMPTCSAPIGEAIVRLEVIDALVDSDWLLISNLLALKHGMKAEVLRDRGDYPQAEIETQEAIRILRADNEVYSPQRGLRINARPHGHAHPSRIFAGFR
jgi:hypothetical protein